jgi:protein-S-isoprenylcysteine O-methyltransferase Ste14
MLTRIAKATGFLAYFLITLEMVFMVTPFALYYYSIDRPFLLAPLKVPVLAWLPAFFLPHLSAESFPNIGNLIVLLALIAFLVGAAQVYYAKFAGRGVVRGGSYKHIRHPQYLFLGLAGLGFLITWPRFILLLIYINMLWFYYVLARSEERRMEARFGDAYRELKQRTWMFLPGEPGCLLHHRLFGWIKNDKFGLAVVYVCSLAVAIAFAFMLRGLSLRSLSHTTLEAEKTAAISFEPMSESQLREILRSLDGNGDVESERSDGRWILVQIMEGKHRTIHTVTDAGMTKQRATQLSIIPTGIKMVVSKQKNQVEKAPFGPFPRWQPVLILELNGTHAARTIHCDPTWFSGNPVMPIF